MRYLITIVIAALSLNAYGQVPEYVPTDGLVAWWPFNGNANDESGNGNNGTNNGGILSNDRNNNSNSAYYFSGNSCSTRVDANIDTTEISINNSFSVSVWSAPGHSSR